MYVYIKYGHFFYRSQIMEFFWYIYKKKNKFSQSIKIYLNKTVWNQEYEKNETKFLVQCKQAINNALITTLIQVSAHLNHIYKWTFLITRCSTSLCSSVRLSLFKLSHFLLLLKNNILAQTKYKKEFLNCSNKRLNLFYNEIIATQWK